MTINNERIKILTRQGRFHDLINMLEEEIPKVESQNKKLHLEYQLAEAYYSIRDSKNAKKIVERLLPKFQKLGNHSMVGDSENILGKIYRLHQRYSDALVHYQNAEKAFKLAKNNEGLSKIYHNLGNVYIFLERFKEAQKFHFKALEIAQLEGKQEAIGSSHLNIGSMYYQNGEVDLAMSHFEKARDVFKEIQDITNLAATYHNLAESYFLRREYISAQKNSSKAASLYEKLQNVLGQNIALTTQARSAKAAGSIDKAIDTYNQIENPTDGILLELGECYLNQNQADIAKKTFERILELPTRNSLSIGYSLDNLARIAINKEEFEEARKIYTQLLEVLFSMKPQDPDSIASTQGNLGYMHLKMGALKPAWEYLIIASDYFKKRKNWDELITLGSNYRNELVATKDYQGAITVSREFILPVVRKSKDKMQENQYHYEVALLYHLKGETEEGFNYWKKKYNRKIAFQKYSAPFLASVLDESNKKELEKQHLRFLKQLLNRK